MIKLKITQITKGSAIWLILVGALISVNVQAYKGALGISGQTGISFLPTKKLNSPESIPGLTGGIRVFFGITNAIGIEAAFSGAIYQNYTPTISQSVADENGQEGAPNIISLTPIERPQQQQYSIGLIYNFDNYRLIPSFSLGVARTVTGARSVSYGESFPDNHLYISGALDFKITPRVWAGMSVRINTPISDNLPPTIAYGGSSCILLRMSYVWRIRRYDSQQKRGKSRL
ncbi:MAG: hypothetical protein JXR76_31895 [Deltaproteobacteria bacterium]|nr:hypothetical protein [Deltaproteobacteria bacterium]